MNAETTRPSSLHCKNMSDVVQNRTANTDKP